MLKIINKIVRTFGVVTTGLVILSFLSGIIYKSNEPIVSTSYFGYILLLAFITSALGWLFHWLFEKINNKHGTILEHFLQIIVIIIAVLLFLKVCGWNDGGGMMHMVITVAAVIILYIVAMVINYRREKKEADWLNNRIQKHRQKYKDDSAEG